MSYADQKRKTFLVTGAASGMGRVLSLMLAKQGMTGKGYMVDKLDDAGRDKILAINLNGVKSCLRAEIQHMKRPGSIVNAASIAGQLGEPNNSPYTVSKRAVIGLSKVVAKEAGARGTRSTPLHRKQTDLG